MHAIEFLKQIPDQIPPVTVLSGGQRHLKQSVLTILKKLVINDDETSLTSFIGRDADLQSVTDELRTMSMWSDRRLIIVDDADEFVTKYRSGLEKYVEKPSKKSVLVLNVKTWTKTTRLAKQVAASGLDVDCSELKGPQLLKWLQDSAKDTYHQSLSRDAAVLLIELVGDELGMLDQELSKLATYVGAGAKIEFADVQTLVGGWRTETTWAMTDAARDGDLAFAIGALDQLLTAGEAGPKLLGGISFVFKKLAQATDLSRTMPLDQALRQSGVFPQAVPASQAFLRRVGRNKAEQILNRLLATDAGLKGGSRLPERIQLEKLLLELSGGI
ncbi:MAG: polymerase delta subunit [Schlesneria sp.]|nr:polymerase delta subunit [Schlesneria sp.]